MTIAIIDYGCGNLHSVAKAFEQAARNEGKTRQIYVTSSVDEVKASDHVVLPGVGAFHECRTALKSLEGMEQALFEHVHEKGKPFLGICVGMQLLAQRGLEYQETEGLSWIAGTVTRIMPDDPHMKIPHMGWNNLTFLNPHPVIDVFRQGESEFHAYFVHSYAFEVKNPAHVIAQTDYGKAITAIIADGPIIGTQFHPEKSQAFGLRFLQNFLRWRP